MTMAQTRSNNGEILDWDTIAEAFEYAERNDDVWKVSFGDTDGRRIRLICATHTTDGTPMWLFRPMEREIFDELDRVKEDES